MRAERQWIVGGGLALVIAIAYYVVTHGPLSPLDRLNPKIVDLTVNERSYWFPGSRQDVLKAVEEVRSEGLAPTYSAIDPPQNGFSCEVVVYLGRSPTFAERFDDLLVALHLRQRTRRAFGRTFLGPKSAWSRP
jgi:hypothetical protein